MKVAIPGINHKEDIPLKENLVNMEPPKLDLYEFKRIVRVAVSIILLAVILKYTGRVEYINGTLTLNYSLQFFEIIIGLWFTIKIIIEDKLLFKLKYMWGVPIPYIFESIVGDIVVLTEILMLTYAVAMAWNILTGSHIVTSSKILLNFSKLPDQLRIVTIR